MNSHAHKYNMDKIFKSLQSISDLLDVEDIQPILLEPYLELLLEKAHKTFTKVAKDLDQFELQSKLLECRSEEEQGLVQRTWEKDLEQHKYHFEHI